MNKRSLESFILDYDATFHEAVEKLEYSKLGIILFIDKDKKLLGVITDGDIRKAILYDIKKDDPIKKILNKNPKIIYEDEISLAPSISEDLKLASLPVIDKSNQLLGLYSSHLDSVLRWNQDKFIPSYTNNLCALVLAGGEGKRLRPLTIDTPKSLAKIRGTSLIERNVDMLLSFGIDHIKISVNYLKEKIIEKILEKYDSKTISFIAEESKLGTAGPLFIEDFSHEHVLVMNADVVTKFNINSFIEHHKVTNADATIICANQRFVIDYGVVQYNNEGDLIRIEEKPTKDFWCSAGIYLFNSNVLNKDNFFDGGDARYLDMPDLLTSLINLGKKVKIFPLIPEKENWFDVANKDDLEEINKADWPFIKNEK